MFILLARGLVPAWRAGLAGALGTCLTHPLLVFVWSPFMQGAGQSYTTYIVSGELMVAAIESLTFFALARPIPLYRAVSASFIANAASYGLGQLLRWLGVLF